MPITRLRPGPLMSQATIHENVVYTAGQVDSTASDVTTQTKEILSKIDGLLAEAGTDKTQLLSANIWLSDVATFGEMNSVWEAWVAPGATPARATVGSILAAPQYKVEIAVIAALRGRH